MTGSPCRGLFLDLDGTLADSLGVMRGVYRRFLESRSRRGSDAEFSALNGPPLAEVVGCLAVAHGLDEPVDDLLAGYRRLIAEAYDAVEPMSGAAALVGAAGRHGWIVGVVTSGARDIVRPWLERTGLAEGVDVLVTAEDVGRGKPAPDPYRLALQRGRCAAAVSIAVEDSPQGARAAVAAGLRTFGIEAAARHPRGAWPDGVCVVSGLTRLVPVVEEDCRA